MGRCYFPIHLDEARSVGLVKACVLQKIYGHYPFLDTLVTVKEDGSLSTSIYRKLTHTNQYLQWDSHHSIANKYSVINSLLHRANNICSNQEQKKEELTYVEEALTICKYPSWAIQRVKLKKNIQKQNKNNKRTNNNIINNRSSITVPYNQGLSKSFKNIEKKKVWHPSTFQEWKGIKR